MTTDSASNTSPTEDFSQCHVGIMKNFQQLKQLGECEISDPVQPDIQALADKLVRFYHDVVLTHHQEEEQELFTAVINCARPGDELNQAKAMVQRLTKEHRSLEKQWKKIEGDIKKLAKGKSVKLDKAATIKMAEHYLFHANYEEDEFLPLSSEILKDTGMSSLGLTLHMRHDSIKVPTYI